MTYAAMKQYIFHKCSRCVHVISLQYKEDPLPITIGITHGLHLDSSPCMSAVLFARNQKVL